MVYVLHPDCVVEEIGEVASQWLTHVRELPASITDVCSAGITSQWRICKTHKQEAVLF